MFQLTEEIKGARSIGISGHIRPDGDCVGSAMALYLYLQKMVLHFQLISAQKCILYL